VALDADKTLTPPLEPGVQVFRPAAVLTAMVFAALVGLLLVADASFLIEFFCRADPDRVAAVRQDVLSAETCRELVLSLTTASITTLLGMLIAVPAGYALSRCRIPGKVAVDTLVDAAIVLPPLILGVSLLVLFSGIRRLAEALGSAAGPNLFLQGFYDFFVYQRPGIVLAQFFVATAICVRAMRAAFDAADPRVEAVALTLGCTPFGAFWRAALPQAVGGMVAGAVVAWSYSVGLFAPVAIFAGTVRGRTAVLPTRTYLEVSVGRLEVALVLTLVMAAISMLVLVVFKTLARQRTQPAGGPP
jgi:molybdate transport system permease protein